MHAHPIHTFYLLYAAGQVRLRYVRTRGSVGRQMTSCGSSWRGTAASFCQPGIIPAHRTATLAAPAPRWLTATASSPCTWVGSSHSWFTRGGTQPDQRVRCMRVTLVSLLGYALVHGSWLEIWVGSRSAEHEYVYTQVCCWGNLRGLCISMQPYFNTLYYTNHAPGVSEHRRPPSVSWANTGAPMLQAGPPRPVGGAVVSMRLSIVRS